MHPLLVEAKQYGVECFVSLVLLTLTVQWWRRPDRTRWLWALAAAAPAAAWLSYTAIFVGGAISLFVGWMLWSEGRVQNAKCKMQSVKCSMARRFYFCILHFAFCTLHLSPRHPSSTPNFPSPVSRRPRRLLPWLAFNLALAGAVASLYFVSARYQAVKSLENMQRDWDRGFPPVLAAAGAGGLVGRDPHQRSPCISGGRARAAAA